MSKNEHFARYEERKAKVVALLEDVGEYLRDGGKDDDAASIFKLRDDVEKNLFSVVLIGEFSVGKSTFLNALMHRRMLPSFKKETTATVNFLRHKSKAPNGEAGIVYYRGGTTKTLPDLNVDTIARFVSTKGDTDDQKISETVEKVDLFLDSKFLEDGVMLVDSPGLNGITENLEAITRRQIKESHACIFMFTAERPGTRVEFEMLRDLRDECNRIFIVLNKVEDIRADEGETIESVVEHLKEHHKKFFPDESLPEIYPISAYFALAARDKSVVLERDAGKVKDDKYYSTLEKNSRLGIFEDRLCRYLTEGERAREQLSEPVNKAGNALTNERDDLDAQIKSLEESRSTEELERQKLELEEAVANLQRERQTKTQPLHERFNVTMRDFKNKIDARCSELCKKIATEAEYSEDVDELKKFAEDLPDILKRQMLDLSRRLEDELRDDLTLVVNESGEFFSELQETLSTGGGGELKISVRDLKLSATDVGKNLESMEKLFAEKRREMDELEVALKVAETDRAKARKIERQRDDLRHQLREISERRNAVFDTFVIPDVERRTRTVSKTRERGGILGFIAGIFIGDERYDDTEEFVDPTGRDEAIKFRNERLADIDSEREKVLQEMKKYSTQTASDDIDADIQRKTNQLEKLNAEYKADVEKYTQEIERNAEKARRKIQREIKNFVEDFVAENSRAINSYLVSTEKQMFAAVCGILETQVNEEIARQQKKIDMLIEDSKASETQRDEKIQQAQSKLERVTELLSRVAELEIELDELNDEIAEV